MASYIYPAIFHANDNGSYTVIFPDLPGCITEGKNLENALYMAQDALHGWMEYTVENGDSIPAASRPQDVRVSDGEFMNLIRTELKDGRAVRRTVSIPKWMDDMVADQGLSLSRVLQDALIERLS